ncbi:hypothetical protein GYMLUDRAFT_243605 [Collybiopsis luxurians FD-317 M1]|uniref:Rhodopsin domain-containing protein n=1 Tax=Collybiopsis luxurians FD-317 M1 TaxID=944289 RepID=A0A0D0BZS1_9AGAR|nr:hypothetical protein GYMLUDRAFT_243605 [Collybiopsis luxurians FD-317 M1]
MLSKIHIGLNANRVVVIAFLLMVLVTMLVRICIRSRNRRLWWDDGCTFLAALFTVLMYVGEILADHTAVPATPNAHRLKIIQFWVILIAYCFAIWFAKITLMLSIVRLIPTFLTLRRVSELASIGFLLMCTSITTYKIYICASDVSWYKLPNPLCKAISLRAIGITELITYVAADVTLLAIPLRLLYHVSLSTDKKRMLIFMFSVNLITSAISILHVILLIDDAWSLLNVTLEVEVGIALVTANLAVIVPYFYRMINPEGDFDSKPFTYYRSVQPDGGVRMRRVADLVTDIRSTNEPQLSVSAIGRVPTTIRLPESDTETISANVSAASSVESKNSQSSLHHHSSFVSLDSDVLSRESSSLQLDS